MKILPSTRPFVVLALVLAAAGFTSCQNTSTTRAARQIDRATYTEVQSFNGAMNPASRQFATAGALPERVREAITMYISTGEWKTLEYARPQYYVIVDNAVWAICTDTKGKLTGIMALPGHGKKITKRSDARLRPASGKYRVIYNTTDEAPVLEYEILKGLEPYDAYRKNIRTAQGLTTPAVAAPAKTAPTPVVRSGGTTQTHTPATAAKPVAQPAPQTSAEQQDPDTLEDGEETITTEDDAFETGDAEGTVADDNIEEEAVIDEE